MAKWVSAAHEIHRTKAELSWNGRDLVRRLGLLLSWSWTGLTRPTWAFFYMNIRWLEKGSPSQLRQGSLCRISPTLGSVLLLNICTFGHFFHLKQSAPAKGLFKSRGTEEARHSWTWVWIQKCILLSDHLIINEKIQNWFPTSQDGSKGLLNWGSSSPSCQQDVWEERNQPSASKSQSLHVLQSQIPKQWWWSWW